MYWFLGASFEEGLAEIWILEQTKHTPVRDTPISKVAE